MRMHWGWWRVLFACRLKFCKNQRTWFQTAREDCNRLMQSWQLYWCVMQCYIIIVKATLFLAMIGVYHWSCKPLIVFMAPVGSSIWHRMALACKICHPPSSEWWFSLNLHEPVTFGFECNIVDQWSSIKQEIHCCNPDFFLLMAVKSGMTPCSHSKRWKTSRIAKNTKQLRTFWKRYHYNTLSCLLYIVHNHTYHFNIYSPFNSQLCKKSWMKKHPRSLLVSFPDPLKKQMCKRVWARE